MEDEISKVKDECKTQVSKYQQDIDVYEEALKMLQKQVEILQDMADAECEQCAEMATTAIHDAECEQCAEMAKTAITEESRHEELMKKATEEAKEVAKEEARQEFVSRMNTQKLEHESTMMNKNADIADLQEKCHKREESMEKLEKLCAKARKDLLHLMDQKKFLEGSLERSIQYIKDLKQSQEVLDAEAMDAIELVATTPTSPRNSHHLKGSRMCVRFHDNTMNDLDAICAPIIESTSHIKMAGPPKSCKDLGSELDALLTSIETQLGVGQCGATKSGSQFNQSREARDELSTNKSW